MISASPTEATYPVPVTPRSCVLLQKVISPSKPLGTDSDHNQTSLFHALISIYLLRPMIIYILFRHLSWIYQTVPHSQFSDRISVILSSYLVRR